MTTAARRESVPGRFVGSKRQRVDGSGFPEVNADQYSTPFTLG